MLEQLLLTVLAMLALGMAVLLAVTWRLLRWLRRSPRLRQRVRTVQAMAAPPGPRREVAWLRRELAAAARATTEALAVVRAAGGPLGDLPHLARRLARVAGTLDAELRLLAGEPDPAELARVLPAAGARVAEVTLVARSIRRAASAGLGAETAAELAPLQAEVEREVAALDAGVDRLLAEVGGVSGGSGLPPESTGPR
jgi:HAMP domain-containing protein